MVDKVRALCPLGASDHISLNIILALYAEGSTNRPSLDYFTDEFVSLKSVIKDVNLTNHVQGCDNINDKWDCFHIPITDGANLFATVRKEMCC